MIKHNVRVSVIFLLAIAIVLGFSFTTGAYARDLTLLFTGETHAMIYPCNCPKEPDGGLSRRATLINKLRNSDTLILDSGAFFAGGLMDEYTQNTELDMLRTDVNIAGMGVMQYDAASIGDEEFDFGVDFLQKKISKAKFPFLSCNIQSDKVTPYIIKEKAGVKVGIIGVTGLSAMPKAVEWKFLDPRVAVEKAVVDLKKKGVDIIILLSHLGEEHDLRLIKSIPDIDVVIVGGARQKDEVFEKINSTIVLRPSWEGRKLGKAVLGIASKKIVNFKAEELRLSDKIADDKGIISILPVCFSDGNCKKEGMIAVCQNPGTIQSKCIFSPAAKVKLTIVLPKNCTICETKTIERFLQAKFKGITISYLYYPDSKALNVVKEFSLTSLPVYLLDKSVDKEKGFEDLKDNVEVKGDYYMLKTAFAGMSYYLDRKREKGRLDLFISLYDKNTRELLDVIKEFKPRIHFLAIEQDGKFDAARSTVEVEECLRGVCMQKHYPQYFWSYITCRSKNILSSWWEDCISDADATKIKACAKSEEGIALLKENISMNKDLNILFGPAYLVDNQEVFGTQGVPKRQELKKFLKR